MTATTTTKTTTRVKTILVMVKPFTFNEPGEPTWGVGKRVEVDARGLRPNGYVGGNGFIPRDHFRLEEVTIKRTVIEEATITEIA